MLEILKQNLQEMETLLKSAAKNPALVGEVEELRKRVRAIEASLREN